VLERGWKLTHAGDLFDMSDAPFAEKPVSPGDANDAGKAARVRLQAALDRLNPAAGKLAPKREPLSNKEKKRKKEMERKKKEKAAAAKSAAVSTK
jgi:hypothetical protein